MGWKYKTGEWVKIGDRVRISKKWAAEHGANEGIVTGLSGFVTVTLTNDKRIDFDMRSLTFLYRDPFREI